MSKNRVRLTDRGIKALQPGSKVVDFPDSVQRGLVLRVWPSGEKSWGVRYWWQGKSTRLSLGPYQDLNLTDARELAADARKAKRRGQNPRDVLFPEPEEEAPATTLADAAQRWLRHQRAHKMRSADNRYRILEIHVLPTLGDHPIEEIERAEISALLEDLRDRRKLTAQTNRVHTALSGIFTWALDAGLITSHPMVRMRRKVPEGERPTILTLDQLVAVWNAAGEIPSTAGDISRLLILLACRREEATGMRWSELNLPATEWHIPAERTKGKRARTVPMPPVAVEIIEGQGRWMDGSYVFSSQRGQTPFRGWKRAAAMLRDKAELVDASGQPLRWHVHDIRGAVTTIMGGDPLRVPEETVARILAHSDRARRGVTAKYDQNPRLGEVGDALRAWAEYFLLALKGRGQVIELPRKIG
jgi:integrase